MKRKFNYTRLIVAAHDSLDASPRPNYTASAEGADCEQISEDLPVVIEIVDTREKLERVMNRPAEIENPLKRVRRPNTQRVSTRLPPQPMISIIGHQSLACRAVNTALN